ncbi:MAG: porin PorA family protein [Actinomycetota bacterium]
MARARNAIGNTLVLIGVAMLIFAVLWWGVAIKRIVVFPRGYDLSFRAEATVTRLAEKHGLLRITPAQTGRVPLDRRLSSMNGDYHGDIAVVEEVIEADGQAPFGLNLDERNIYVMDRRSCENMSSTLSTSSGEVVDRSGSWYVNFPFGAGRDSRNLFDNDVASAFAVNFEKKDVINGVGVYLFKGSHGHRPMVDYEVRAIGLPTETTFGEIKGELAAAGIPIDTLVRSASSNLTPEERQTFAQFPDSRPIALEYSVKLEWEGAVEPVTGTIVKIGRCRRSVYVNTEVRTFLPLFEILARHAEDPQVLQYLSQVEQQRLLEPKELYRIDYGWTDAQAAQATEYAGSRIGPMRFVQDYMVTLFLLLGAGFFLGGFIVRRKEHMRTTHDAAGPDEGEGKGAEEEKGP